MSARLLHRTGLSEGLYRGVLTGGDTAPALEASCDGRAFPVTVEPVADGWAVTADLSGLAPSEGTRTVTIAEGGAVLDAVTVVAGLSAPEDMRAELDLLRAELDMLKAAFRRHVRETEG